MVYISDKRIVSLKLKRLNQLVIEYAMENRWLMCLNLSVSVYQDRLFALESEKAHIKQNSELLVKNFIKFHKNGQSFSSPEDEEFCMSAALEYLLKLELPELVYSVL